MPTTPVLLSDQPQPHTRVRLDSIDALRGVAALMVAGFHVWGHYGIYPFPSIGVVQQELQGGIFSYIVSPLRWGYLGVGLFLVLSGFCIHLPFARRRQEKGDYGFDARQFYLRRMWRLYPAYAVSVIATFILLEVTAHGTSSLVDAPPSIWDLVTHLTLTHGYFDRYFYGIVSVFWSLALEFQLYLAYPIFLLLFRKIGVSRSILLLVVVSIIWRYIAMEVFHHQLMGIAQGGPFPMMGFLLARMPEWLFGVWLAEWFARGRHVGGNRLGLAGMAVVVLYMAIVTTLYEPLWKLTDIVFGLGFAFVIASAIVPSKRISSAPKGAYKLIVWLGTISYSIYLFHLQLSWFANAWIRHLPDARLAFGLRVLVLVISIPIIALIFRFVEKPFLKAPTPGDSLFNIYAKLSRLLGIKTDAMMAVQRNGTAPR